MSAGFRQGTRNVHRDFIDPSAVDEDGELEDEIDLSRYPLLATWSGEVGLHKLQLVLIGVAEPEHRRLGLGLLDGSDARPSPGTRRGNPRINVDAEGDHAGVGGFDVVGIEDDRPPHRATGTADRAPSDGLMQVAPRLRSS